MVQAVLSIIPLSKIVLNISKLFVEKLYFIGTMLKNLKNERKDYNNKPILRCGHFSRGVDALILFCTH